MGREGRVRRAWWIVQWCRVGEHGKHGGPCGGMILQGEESTVKRGVVYGVGVRPARLTVRMWR